MKNKEKNMNIMNEGFDIAETIFGNETLTYTKPGGLNYRLFGREFSKQSISVKFGKWGEKFFTRLVEITPDFTMLPHGVLKGIGKDGKSKDVDFLFKDDMRKVVYYRELKGNINLDTEKLPATYEKIDYLSKYIETTYPEYKLNHGCLNWSVWDGSEYGSHTGTKTFLTKIKTFEKNGVPVTFTSEIFKILNIDMDEKTWNDFLLEIGERIPKK